VLLAGVGTYLISRSGPGSAGPNPATSSQTYTGTLTPSETAKALIGHRFTRNVVPAELAGAGPFRDVFVDQVIPGLVGQSTTSTSDLGGTITIYVFADPAWANAFYSNPPTAYGCSVCTTMAGGAPVRGVGDRAMSYVLYRKTAGGQAWVATTTYVLSGPVVINAVYFPVNVANPYPSAIDLALPTDYARAAIQLLNKLGS
jgi:hypothetical protein